MKTKIEQIKNILNSEFGDSTNENTQFELESKNRRLNNLNPEFPTTCASELGGICRGIAQMASDEYYNTHPLSRDCSDEEWEARIEAAKAAKEQMEERLDAIRFA